MTISGFFRGAALANFTLSVSESCSLERLPAAFGWHLIGKAVFVVALGPLIGKNFLALPENHIKLTKKNVSLAGLIRDVTGSYPLCIHSQSFCIAMCCFIWIIEYFVIRFKERRNESVDPNPTWSPTKLVRTNAKLERTFLLHYFNHKPQSAKT